MNTLIILIVFHCGLGADLANPARPPLFMNKYAAAIPAEPKIARTAHNKGLPPLTDCQKSLLLLLYLATSIPFSLNPLDGSIAIYSIVSMASLIFLSLAEHSFITLISS